MIVIVIIVNNFLYQKNHVLILYESWKKWREKAMGKCNSTSVVDDFCPKHRSHLQDCDESFVHRR